MATSAQPEHLFPATGRRNQRAPKACLLCRARKVRCDVVARLPGPCTNCSLDGAACQLAEHRARRVRSVASKQVNAARHSFAATTHSVQSPSGHFRHSDGVSTMANPHIDAGSVNSAISGGSSMTVQMHTPVPSLTSEVGNWSLYSPNSPNVFDLSTPAAVGGETPTIAGSEVVSTFEDIFGLDMMSSHEMVSVNPILACDPLSSASETQRKSTYGKNCDCTPLCSQPLPWIRPWCTADLAAEHTAQIAEASALSIPSMALIECILKHYFRFAHFHLPVVSEKAIHSMLHPLKNPENVDSQVTSISLTLFNAIMFIGSAFVTTEDAQEAGYHTPRELRAEFERKARVLYEAGCVVDDLDRVRICLLLSTGPRFSTEKFDIQEWVLEAQSVLQQTNIVQSISQGLLPANVAGYWRILVNCCILRTHCILIGSHRATVACNFQFDYLPLDLCEMDAELNFAWFLSVEEKMKQASMFLARLRLFKALNPLCQVLLRDSRANQTYNPSAIGSTHRRSIMGELEEAENSIADWKIQHDELLRDITEPSTKPQAADLPIRVHGALLRLEYEYIIFSLHQTSFISSGPNVTSWMAKVREASLHALQEAAANTTKILQDLLSWDAVRFVPVTVTSCVFVPLTINAIVLKSSTALCARTIDNMHVCTQVFEQLSKRYELTDFYRRVYNSSLHFIHSSLAKDHPLFEQSTLSLPPRELCSVTSDVETYSRVLQLQKQLYMEV